MAVAVAIASFACTECGMQFKKQCKLDRHIADHSEARPFVCALPDCEKAFKRSEHLTRHMDTHNETSWPCSQCQSVLASKQSLHRHELAHSTPKIPTPQKIKPPKIKPQKSYSCMECNQSFNLWTLLLAHNRDVHLTCKTCGIKFKKQYALTVHQRTHSALTPFKCIWEACTHEFKSPGALRVHIKSSHLKVKPHKCQFCECEFTLKQVCRNHELTHEINRVKKTRVDKMQNVGFMEALTGFNHPRTSNQRKFECLYRENGCEFRFNRQYDLSRHLKSMHSNEEASNMLIDAENGYGLHTNGSTSHEEPDLISDYNEDSEFDDKYVDCEVNNGFDGATEF